MTKSIVFTSIITESYEVFDHEYAHDLHLLTIVVGNTEKSVDELREEIHDGFQDFCKDVAGCPFSMLPTYLDTLKEVYPSITYTISDVPDFGIITVDRVYDED